MKFKNIAPSEKHQAARDAVMQALKIHAAELPAVEILALMAHVVGQLIAVQDHRVMTVNMAFEVIEKNIEAGNKDATAMLLSAGGKEN